MNCNKAARKKVSKNHMQFGPILLFHGMECGGGALDTVARSSFIRQVGKHFLPDFLKNIIRYPANAFFFVISLSPVDSPAKRYSWQFKS